MKDYSGYSNAELFGIENYLDCFKHQDKIEAVRKEINLRRDRGEITLQIVPTIDWEPLKFWKKRRASVSTKFTQQELAHGGNY